MKLIELTNKLQDLCHEGYSNCDIVIKVLDGFYKAGDVLKVLPYGKENIETITSFAIEAEV